MPRLRENGRNYGKSEAERYVKYLGLWTFVNPIDVAKRRDLNDYRECLQQLISVNKTRKDDVGKWETAEAQRQLKALKR